MTEDTPAKAETVSARLARDAERRRELLRRAIGRSGLPLAELARQAGLSTANSLYNFLSGRSLALSLRTLERIASALGVRVGDLVDEEPGLSAVTGYAKASQPSTPNPTGFVEVPIALRARSGLWLRDPWLPRASRTILRWPGDLLPERDDIFCVRVDEPGAENLYPMRTLLICVPVVPHRNQLPVGTNLVVIRERLGRYEVSVRQLVDYDGEPWLWPRSDHPMHQTPTRLPTAEGTADLARDTAVIHHLARVIASWQPEDDL